MVNNKGTVIQVMGPVLDIRFAAFQWCNTSSVPALPGHLPLKGKALAPYFQTRS